MSALRLIRAARDVNDPRLRVVDRHALLVLSTFADPQTGDMQVPEGELLDALQCSRSSLYERLRRLEHLGYLRSVRQRNEVCLRTLQVVPSGGHRTVRDTFRGGAMA